MRLIAVVSAACAAAAATLVMVGCGSSGPTAAQIAAHKRAALAAQQKTWEQGNAKAACRGLAAAAAAFDDGYGQGGLAGTMTNASTWIGGMDKALTPGFGETKLVHVQPISGFYPPKMGTDLSALAGLTGFPMQTSSAEAGGVQVDCDNVGLTAPIWPQYPITP